MGSRPVLLKTLCFCVLFIQGEGGPAPPPPHSGSMHGDDENEKSVQNVRTFTVCYICREHSKYSFLQFRRDKCDKRIECYNTNGAGQYPNSSNMGCYLRSWLARLPIFSGKCLLSSVIASDKAWRELTYPACRLFYIILHWIRQLVKVGIFSHLYYMVSTGLHVKLWLYPCYVDIGPSEI